MKRDLTVIDLFSGAGGLSLGLEQAGFTSVLGVEQDLRASQSYQHNFPVAIPIVDDAAYLTGDELLERSGFRECDLVAGGPPCQAFSMAGQRRKEDARGLLPLAFAHRTAEIGPRYFVMENVPGILLPQFAGLRRALYDVMRHAGYRVAEPWVLNSAAFGVPQLRSRVFIVGARTGLRLPSSPTPHDSPAPTAMDAIRDLEAFDRGAEQPTAAITVYAQRLRGEAADPSDLSAPRCTLEQMTGCARTVHTTAVTARFAATAPGAKGTGQPFLEVAPGSAILSHPRGNDGTKRRPYGGPTDPLPLPALHHRARGRPPAIVPGLVPSRPNDMAWLHADR